MWPEYLVLAAWFLPPVMLAMAVTGAFHGTKAKTCRSSELIIQITTIQNQDSANEIIAAVRGYELGIPHRIWVVTEPWCQEGYVGADEVIVVPSDFTCRSMHKARAMEYTRLRRRAMGLDGRDIKLLFLDDDSLPTRSYILKAFAADYDICEGIIVPRNHYGRLLSHMDNLRTFNCIVFCSITQGFGQPVHVHGEGLCVRSSAEQLTTWNYPVFASEDCVFGHMAAQKGLRWGFFYDYVQITSPWTWRDYFTQRRRWTWGNIHAVRHVLPWKGKLLLTGKYIFGSSAFYIATTGTVLDLLGLLAIPSVLRPILITTALFWVSIFAMTGWIASGGSKKHALVAALLAWVTVAVHISVLLLSIARGNPRNFEVISKTKAAAFNQRGAESV